MMPDPLLRRHVSAAVARHGGIVPAIRAVAAELSPRDRRPWVAMADALARGDVAAGATAAAADPACWMPLFSTPAGDPRLLGRIVAAAAGPAVPTPRGWLPLVVPLTLVALAFGLLGALSFGLTPLLEEVCTELNMELPPLTQRMLGTAAFMRGIWKPLLLGAGLVIAGWGLTCWWIRRGSAVAAAYTRHLARLVESGVPQDEAVELAAWAVGVPPVSPARPRRPLSHAAVAALAHEPAVAGGLLDAVAECHALRIAGTSFAAGSLWRTLAFGVVLLTVGLYLIGILLPLINLIRQFS